MVRYLYRVLHIWVLHSNVYSESSLPGSQPRDLIAFEMEEWSVRLGLRKYSNRSKLHSFKFVGGKIGILKNSEMQQRIRLKTNDWIKWRVNEKDNFFLVLAILVVISWSDNGIYVVR